MLVTSSASLALALVFGFSGPAKLCHPRSLAGLVANYGLVPRQAAGPAGVALALAETVTAVLLLLPATRLGGLALAGALVVVFLTAMSLALASGRRIPCGCFGGAGLLSPVQPDRPDRPGQPDQQLDTVGVPSLLRTALLGVLVAMSLTAWSAPARPAQILVAALLVALVFLAAETSRLLLPSPAPAPTAGGTSR